MHERRWLDDAEAQRLRDDLLAHAVPIRYAGPRAVELGGRLLEVPFVQLDGSARPEVADLFRVVAAEGSQRHMASTFRYLLLGDQGYLEINVSLADPVDCAFKFVLAWPAHRALFELLLRQGRLLFTAQTLNPEHEVSTLGVTISAAELEPMMRLWRQHTDSGLDDR